MVNAESAVKKLKSFQLFTSLKTFRQKMKFTCNLPFPNYYSNYISLKGIIRKENHCV